MWSIIAIEGFCFGESKDERYPCGQKHPTSFCLSNDLCPHLAYSETSERDVALFVPIYQVLWDRIKLYFEKATGSLEWIFWEQLWLQQKKTKEFFESIKPSLENCPSFKEWEEKLDRANVEFGSWLKKALEEAK